jgi:mono/diheme cytochrome c family protein
MRQSGVVLAAVAIATGAAAYAVWNGVAAEGAQVARGKYLVQLAGCTDCHTPGHFLGRPDMARFLGGSNVGFEIPDLGIFVGPNLTPDKDTGLGSWTSDEIVTAIQTGVRPDGRMLVPVMPWRAYAGLTKSDAAAIVDYLRSLPPVTNKVPGPLGLNEKATVFRMKILPPDQARQLN